MATVVAPAQTAQPVTITRQPYGYTVIDAQELKAALDKLQKFCARRSTLPVLGNVLIEATPGQLTLTATNLEQALRIFLNTRGIGQYSTTVYLPQMRDTLAHVSGKISMTIEEKHITDTTGATSIHAALVILKAQGGGTIRFKDLMNAGEYPTQPIVNAINLCQMYSNDFSREIERVGRAAAKDEARPVFTGILFQLNYNDGCKLVAADSYRVHISPIRPYNLSNEAELLLPAKGLQTLCSILPKEQTLLAFATNKDYSQVAITFDNCLFLTRTIDGSFPAYQRIMPKGEGDYQIRVESKKLLKTVELLSKIAKDSNHIITLGWSKEKGLQLDVTSDAIDQTEYVDGLLRGESKKQHLMLNALYLADACKSFAGDMVIHIWQEVPNSAGKLDGKVNKPVTFTAFDASNDGHTAVLMPMHTIR